MTRLLIVLGAMIVPLIVGCSSSSSVSYEESAPGSQTAGQPLSVTDRPESRVSEITDTEAPLQVGRSVEANSEDATAERLSAPEPDQGQSADSADEPSAATGEYPEELLALPGWDELSEDLKGAMRSNRIFRQEHPEVVAEHTPIICRPGQPAIACSEAYAHRHDPRFQPHYGESGYTESIIQCNGQRDYWRTDGKHPDGEEVITFLDCVEDEYIEPTPTPSPTANPVSR